jgi:hypothetical protein
MIEWTADQEDAFAAINDRWPVAKWTDDGDRAVIVTCDDGDEAIIYPDGSAEWLTTGEAIDVA